MLKIYSKYNKTKFNIQQTEENTNTYVLHYVYIKKCK